jgi:predicted nucleic acid-binding protein
MTYVLDAFALLSHFKNEPGAQRMEMLFEEAARSGQDLLVSVVNLGEVVYKTIRQFGLDRAKEILNDIQQLPIAVIDVDQQLALDAAVIKGVHRISYADCIAAALAQRLGATLVTGDQGFGQIADLQVEWLPK